MMTKLRCLIRATMRTATITKPLKMKENVICGHLIPAGTGLREYESIVVGSAEDDADILNEYAGSPRSVMDVEPVND